MSKGYLLRHKSGMFLCQTPPPGSTWVKTDDPLLALNTSYEKAEQIRNNAFGLKERNDWYIVENGFSNVTLESHEDELFDFSEAFDYKELAISQRELYNSMYHREQELRIKLSTCDKLINDTMHFVELSTPLNVCRGFKTYRLLRQLLQRRRAIKNEIEKANSFLSYTSSDFASGKMEKLINTIEGRTYQPRVMDKLFDVSITPSKDNSESDDGGNEVGVS